MLVMAEPTKPSAKTSGSIHKGYIAVIAAFGAAIFDS